MKTFVMMIGEFEYDNIFNEEFTSTGYTSQVRSFCIKSPEQYSFTTGQKYLIFLPSMTSHF